jgi:hypothetical protein
MYDIIKPYMDIKLFNNIFETSLSKLSENDRQLCTCAINSINDDHFDHLGQHQLNLLTQLIVNTFDNDCVLYIESIHTPCTSTDIYTCFVDWITNQNINNSLKKYLSIVIFSTEFAKKHTKKRTSYGFVWLNVSISHKQKSKDNLVLYIITSPNRLLTMKPANDIRNKLSTNFNHGKNYNCQAFVQINKNYVFDFDAHHFDAINNTIHSLKLIITGKIDYTKLKYISILCNDVTITTIPFEILVFEKTVSQSDDKLVIDVSELPYLFTMSNSNENLRTTIVILSENVLDCEIKLIYQNVCLMGNSVKNRLFGEDNTYDSTCDQIVHMIKKTTYDLELQNKADIRLMIDDVLKGFYIECNNIQDITNIQIIPNGQTSHSYTNDVINEICVKISNTLLYVPLNHEVDRMSVKYESLICSYYCHNVDILKLLITFSKPQQSIIIYTNGCDLLTLHNHTDLNYALKLNASNSYYGSEYEKYLKKYLENNKIIE